MSAPEQAEATVPRGSRATAPRQVGTFAATGAVLGKELRLERRAPQTLVAMAIFSATAFVIFHFALQRDALEGGLAAGVLWVTLTLAALLGIGRSFVADRDEGGLDGFLLAPVDRTALLAAKVLTLLVFLVAIELVAVPLFALLLLEPTPSAGQWLQLAAVLALADIGIAVIGTLVAAMAVRTRARDLITSILVLPLCIPLIIGASQASEPLLSAGTGGAPARWLAVLALYDLIFGLLAWALFDYLVED